MFQEGDVVVNKHHGSVVRLFLTTHQNPEISGLLPVHPTGYVGTGLSNEHWEKVSRWLWVKSIVPHLIKEFVWRLEYQTNKHLGMIDPMDAGTYWKQYPPQYKTVYKTVSEYEFLKYRTAIQELQYPFWREKHYHKPFEISIFRWLVNRLKQI